MGSNLQPMNQSEHQNFHKGWLRPPKPLSFNMCVINQMWLVPVKVIAMWVNNWWGHYNDVINGGEHQGTCPSRTSHFMKKSIIYSKSVMKLVTNETIE